MPLWNLLPFFNHTSHLISSTRKNESSSNIPSLKGTNPCSPRGGVRTQSLCLHVKSEQVWQDLCHPSISIYCCLPRLQSLKDKLGNHHNSAGAFSPSNLLPWSFYISHTRRVTFNFSSEHHEEKNYNENRLGRCIWNCSRFKLTKSRFDSRTRIPVPPHLSSPPCLIAEDMAFFVTGKKKVRKSIVAWSLLLNLRNQSTNQSYIFTSGVNSMCQRKTPIL